MGTKWGAAWVVAATLCSTAGAAQQHDVQVTLQLTRTPGVLRTGDAVLVSVESSASVTMLEGDAFGRPVAFWQAGERQWYGLIGIDVGASAGAYELQVRASSEGGRVDARMPLVVERRRVETRRIRVAERFANPPECGGAANPARRQASCERAGAFAADPVLGRGLCTASARSVNEQLWTCHGVERRAGRSPSRRGLSSR